MTESVLVTGAFGNMGPHALSCLLEAGHNVVALARKNARAEAVAASFSGAIKIIWGDICDPEVISRALEGIDCVVHLAAIMPPFSDHDPGQTIRINQEATLELVRQMEQSPTAKRLIFASSMTLVGPEQHLRSPPLSANIEPKPTDIYGETKAECERQIRASSLYWTILRFAVVPMVDISTREMNSMEAMFHASAEGRLEILHPKDAGLAIANTVTCNDAIGRILMIGGGKSCQSLALPFYNNFLNTIGLKPLSRELLRPGPPYFFGDWLDTKESQKLLSYQRHSIQDYFNDVRKNVGYRRWALKLFSPLIDATLQKRSPHKAENHN